MARKHPLTAHYDDLTADQRAALAKNLKVSPERLRQAAKAYRTGGKPSVSPEFAIALEHETGISRRLTCPSCRACDLAVKADRE